MLPLSTSKNELGVSFCLAGYGLMRERHYVTCGWRNIGETAEQIKSEFKQPGRAVDSSSPSPPPREAFRNPALIYAVSGGQPAAADNDRKVFKMPAGVPADVDATRTFYYTCYGFTKTGRGLWVKQTQISLLDDPPGLRGAQ
jgi:hypothetical protein